MVVICTHQEMGPLVHLVGCSKDQTLFVKSVSSASKKCLGSGISQTSHYLLLHKAVGFLVTQYLMQERFFQAVKRLLSPVLLIC